MSLLEVEGLHKTFMARQRGGEPVRALRDVSLAIESGETLAVIGESGSGKSTLGRAVLRLLEVDEGRITFDGTDLRGLDTRAMQRQRAQMQIVFQEPYESLNPRMPVGSIVAEPVQIHQPELERKAVKSLVLGALERVGLPTDSARRLPGELSGGQQQRVGIARAIITRPHFLVLDEPTSSLDLSIRKQILDLLRELQLEYEMAYLFVSHDIHTVEWVSDRIAVMYLGQIVETAPTPQLFASPSHDYTRTLLSARLSPDPRERHKYVAFRQEEAR